MDQQSTRWGAEGVMMGDRYGRMLLEGYQEIVDFDGRPMSRLEYLSDYIFDFTTYDGAMAELFATKALEVCAAISDRTTFEYIEDPDRYRWYLTMVNMPFFADKLEWGTSVRGAWWDSKITMISCGLYLDGNQVIKPMVLTSDEWGKFIAAVLAFAATQTALTTP